MRKIRALLIVAAIVMMLMAGGCVKTWFVNFATVSNIDDWVLNSTYDLTTDGLVIDANNFVTAPFVWTGDFTVTVKFNVATDITHRVYGAIWMGSLSGYPTSGSIISFFYRRGGVDLPYFQLWTDGPTTDTLIVNTSDLEIPGMVNDAINTYVLEKVSDHFTATLNGVLLGEWDNTRYESEDFYLTLNSGDLVDDEIIYKSVKVQYESGNMTPLAASVLTGSGASGFIGASPID
jgi:hypothetical protein